MADFDMVIDLEKLISRTTNIPKFGDVVNKAVEDGIDEFIERLIEKIKENLVIYGLGDSNLAQTINVQVVDDGVSIIMDSDYAIFVEYGTGITGLLNPHPQPMSGWKYMSGEYSSNPNGWWYPTTESDPNPYKRNIEGKLYAFTRGLPSRPFMYESWLWGARSINNIVNKHIRRALKQLEGEFK